MENTYKPNDYFAARFLNEDKSVDALLANGIDPQTSVLQTPDFYKNKKKVQEKFVKEDGTFDDKSFNEFYNQIHDEYIALSSIDTMNYIMDQYNTNPDVFSVSGKKTPKKAIYSFAENPMHLNEGMSGFNEWDNPELSKRENAQNNHYFDNKTGRWSDLTINEEGFLGRLTGKSLVYATYDNDVYDEETGELLHQKGDWKTDEFGNYYAETAEGKENIGKEFVNISEVLTTDGSAWNTIDIFDSDDITQNIPKTVLKTAAIIGSTFIPYFGIGNIIKYTTAAIEFAKVLPQMAKAINGFFDSDGEYNSLNKWDNTMKRFSASVSDYSKEHNWSFENILNMVSQSFMQLQQQRAIANIPENLGLYKNAQMKSMLSTAMIADKDKGITGELAESLAKLTPLYKSAKADVDKINNVTHALSMAYLVSTSVQDAYSRAKEYGFDNETSSFIALMTYAGIGSLFSTNYFRGILTGTKNAETLKRIKAMNRSFFANSEKDLVGDASKAIGNEAKEKFYKKWGHKISKFYQDHIDEVSSGEFGILSGAISEGVEETTEEIAADIALQMGKGFDSIKSTLTGEEYNNNYDYFKSNPLERYFTAAVGGAIGGAVFKVSDRFQVETSGYKDFKEMLGNNDKLLHQYITLISQGHANDIVSDIAKLRESVIGSANIDANTGEATTDTRTSQKAAIFDTMINGIKDLDAFLTNNNLKVGFEDIENVELLKGLRVAWLKDNMGNNKALKSLTQEYIHRVKEIADLHAEKESVLSSAISEQAKKDEYDVERGRIEAVIETKRNELNDLLQGKDDSYIGRLFLETNPQILNLLSPRSKEDISKNLYSIEYDKLPKYLKSKVDSISDSKNENTKSEWNYMNLWKSYKAISSDEVLKTKVELALQNINGYRHNIGIEVQSGEYVWKHVDGDEIKNEDLVLEVADYIRSISGILRNQGIEIADNDNTYLFLASKILGIDSKYHLESGDIYFSGLVETFDGTFNTDGLILLKSFISDYKQRLREEARHILEKEKPETTIEGRTKGRYGDLNNLDKVLDKLESVINNIDELNDEFASSFFDEPEYIDSNGVLDIVSYIYNKLYNDNINLSQILKDEENKIGLLKDKYQMSDEIRVIFERLHNIVNYQGGLLRGVIYSADDMFSAKIKEIPFGANNFLNRAFKEKRLPIELLNISHDFITPLFEQMNFVSYRIENIKISDLESRKNIINIHKKLAIKYSSAKLASIQNFISEDNLSKVFSDDIKSIFSEEFNGFKIESDDYKIPSTIETDSDYVDVASRLRGKIIDFEQRWYRFITRIKDDGLAIDGIMSYFSNLSQSDDVSSLSYKTNETELFNDLTLLNYLISISKWDYTQALPQYKSIVEESDLLAFDTHEELIQFAIRHLMSNQDVDVKIAYRLLDQKKLNDNKPLKHGLLINSRGGVGKTTLINTLHKLISLVNPKKNLNFVANNNDQLRSLVPDNNVRNKKGILKNEFISILNDEDKFREKYHDSSIIIDEATTISLDDLYRLDDLSDKYNVKYILSGDSYQSGYRGDNLEYVRFHSSPILLDSLRAESDLSRENDGIFEKIVGEKDNNKFQIILNSDDTFKYYIDDSGFYGLNVDENLVFTEDYIKSIKENYHIQDSDTILVFSNNIPKELLDNKDFIKSNNIIIANNIEDVQGLEFDYVLTDINTNFVYSRENHQDVVWDIRELYTLSTRRRKGILFKSNIILNNFPKNKLWTSKVELSKTKPIYSGLADKNLVDKFKEFKLSVLDRFAIKSNTPSIEEVKKAVDTNVKSNPIPVSEPKMVSTNKSVSEWSPGFILKKEMDDNYWSRLGYSDFNTYIQDRMKLFEYMFNREKPKFNNSRLDNGRFRIKKTSGIGVDDLFNLGNENKDHKNLLKESTHLWLVYEFDGGEITIALFQNLEDLKDTVLTPTVANSKLNDLLNNDEFPDGSYIDIDDIEFSRVNNPLSIQSNTEDSSIPLSSITNEDDREYKWLHVTPPIYFNPKGFNEIINAEDLDKILLRIKDRYKYIYEKLSEIYNFKEPNEEIHDISELVNINGNISKGSKIKSVKAKGVPSIYGRFISFARLNTKEFNSDRSSIEELSNIYLGQLLAKEKQLENVLSILNGDYTNEEKKTFIKSELSKKQIWDVSIISFDYPTIKTAEELRYAINGIDLNDKSRMAYNLTIIDQIGTLLARMGWIVKEGTTLYGFITNENSVINKEYKDSTKYLNRKAVDRVNDWFEKNKDILIKALNEFNGGDNTLDDVKDFFRKYHNGSNIGEHNTYFVDKGVNFFNKIIPAINDLYFSMNDIISASNTIKAIKINNSKKTENNDWKIDFSGQVFPELLKDNGIVLNNSFVSETFADDVNMSIPSKVIQPATVRIYLSDDAVFTKEKTTDLIEEAVIVEEVKNIQSEGIVERQNIDKTSKKNVLEKIKDRRLRGQYSKMLDQNPKMVEELNKKLNGESYNPDLDTVLEEFNLNC